MLCTTYINVTLLHDSHYICGGCFGKFQNVYPIKLTINVAAYQNNEEFPFWEIPCPHRKCLQNGVFFPFKALSSILPTNQFKLMQSICYLENNLEPIQLEKGSPSHSNSDSKSSSKHINLGEEAEKDEMEARKRGASARELQSPSRKGLEEEVKIGERKEEEELFKKYEQAPNIIKQCYMKSCDRVDQVTEKILTCKSDCTFTACPDHIVKVGEQLQIQDPSNKFRCNLIILKFIFTYFYASRAFFLFVWVIELCFRKMSYL
jgi:hypothetical protein